MKEFQIEVKRDNGRWVKLGWKNGQTGFKTLRAANDYVRVMTTPNPNHKYPPPQMRVVEGVK